MSAERQPRQATRAALSPRWPESAGAGRAPRFPETISGRAGGSPGACARPRLARGLSPALSGTTRGSLGLTSGFPPALSSTVFQCHPDRRVHTIALLSSSLKCCSQLAFLLRTHARTRMRTHARRRWPLPSQLPANPHTAAAAPARLPHAHLRRRAVSAPSLIRMYVCTSVRTRTHTHTCPGYNLQTLLNQHPDRAANYKTIKTPCLPFSY